MATDQLNKARELVRQLSFQEKLTLLSDLTRELIQQSTAAAVRPLPIIHLSTWPDDITLRREELYDDRAR